MSTLARPKLFRDPIHDIIAFDERDSVEHVLLELIRTGAFQRLRRIRQLGFAHLVYHGAEHSRFSHSLGVVHVARRMFDTLEPQLGLTAEDRLEVLAAAILHDVGHGPFSHAIEKVTGIDHERYTQSLIEDPDGEIHPILASVDPELPARVVQYFGPPDDFPPHRRVLKDIVSSQLDADRQDYILRDGHATGVKIGVYDFERIQTMFEVWEGELPDGVLSRRLAVSHRAREAVEDYLIARFHMYKQVYLHKAVRAAEKMLEATLQRISELAERGELRHPTMRPELHGLLRGEHLESQAYISLDDTDIWVLLKACRHHGDPILGRLAHGLIRRDLYKTIDLDRDDPVLVARTIDRACEEAKKLGLDPDYAVLVDRAQNTPYRPYDPDARDWSSHIPIIDRVGHAAPIEKHSDLIHMLGNDSYKIWRICVPREVRDAMTD